MSGPYKDTARRFEEVALAANKREEQQRLAKTKAKMEALIADPSWLTEELLSTPDGHSTSDVASTPAELAATHDNVIELSAFRNKKKPVIVPSFEPGWEAELRTGTYARSHAAEADGGWFPSKGNDMIKARGDRHRADFTWVGKGLEAEGVLLFVDGTRIQDVEFELDAGTNSMRLFFVLPDNAGKEALLARAETCLEDDGTVRVQLWTVEKK